MHEHDNQRDEWLPLVEVRASGHKTPRYVAIIEGLNHSSSWSKPGHYKETTLFRQWKKKKAWRATKERYLPAEKYTYLLWRFYATYTYYYIPEIY
jgi:hypothetical protein